MDVTRWASSPALVQRYLSLQEAWWTAFEAHPDLRLPESLRFGSWLDALRADVRALGPARVAAPMTHLYGLALGDEPSRRGFCYTCLGSRMGGVVFAKLVRARHGDSIRLRSMDEGRTAEDWRLARAWIDELGTSSPVVVAAVRAAKEGFRRMAGCLEVGLDQPDADVLAADA